MFKIKKLPGKKKLSAIHLKNEFLKFFLKIMYLDNIKSGFIILEAPKISLVFYLKVFNLSI